MLFKCLLANNNLIDNLPKIDSMMYKVDRIIIAFLMGSLNNIRTWFKGYESLQFRFSW